MTAEAPPTVRDGSLRLTTGTELFRRSWLPDGPVRGAIALVHGFGEHSGRYTALTAALPPRGFAVHGFDHVGHGRSGGRRGHIDAWAEYRDAVSALVDAVRAESGEAPVFLFAHSMGGLVALEWLIVEAGAGRTRVAGAILSAPGLIPLEVGKRWQVWASKVLSRAWPSFSMELALGMVSGDADVVAAAHADPLDHRRASARWATEAMAAVGRARAGAATVTVPLLVVHGDADRIVDIAGSRWLVETGDRQTVTSASTPIHRRSPQRQVPGQARHRRPGLARGANARPGPMIHRRAWRPRRRR